MFCTVSNKHTKITRIKQKYSNDNQKVQRKIIELQPQNFTYSFQFKLSKTTYLSFKHIICRFMIESDNVTDNLVFAVNSLITLYQIRHFYLLAKWRPRCARRHARLWLVICSKIQDNLYAHIQEMLWTYSSNYMHTFKTIHVHIFKRQFICVYSRHNLYAYIQDKFYMHIFKTHFLYAYIQDTLYMHISYIQDTFYMHIFKTHFTCIYSRHILHAYIQDTFYMHIYIQDTIYIFISV